MRDGATHPLLPVLATLNKHNAERDFHRLFKRAYGLRLEPYFVEFDLLDPDDLVTVRKEKNATIPMHEMLWHVWADPGRRGMCLFGTEGVRGVCDWWLHARQTPNWASHPAGDDAVPLLCFADGAEVFKTKEYEFFLWHSLLSQLGHGTRIWDMVWLNFLVPSKRIPHKPTFYTAAMKYVAWQARVVLSGRFPREGFYGEAFPEKSWRALQGERNASLPPAAVVGWHGDCKARAEMNMFSSHFNKTSTCDCCLAQGTTADAAPALSFANLREDAPWRSSIIDHAGFVDMCSRARVPLPPLLDIPRVRKESLFFDIAHVKYMGVHRTLIASVLVFLSETGMLVSWCNRVADLHRRSAWPHHELSQTDAGMDAALKEAYSNYRAWCRTNRKESVTKNLFSLSRLGRKNAESYPCVPGWVKAMHLKTLAAWLGGFVREVCRTPEP